jgi:hypothetical protein
MLFTTPVVAGEFEDGVAAYKAGDYQKVFRLFKLLAELGDASVQHNLGLMYDNGDGIPEDDIKAAHRYSKAAEHGLHILR